MTTISEIEKKKEKEMNVAQFILWANITMTPKLYNNSLRKEN